MAVPFVFVFHHLDTREVTVFKLENASCDRVAAE
jgi:hypothetical protein